mmetsp:Transcript_13249/g.35476  ORF Transcript_13249/g.35476 Transcript_13249/m.35476 type:complete len:311 (+) Transcript_13249:260-1192(+)
MAAGTPRTSGVLGVARAFELRLVVRRARNRFHVAAPDSSPPVVQGRGSRSPPSCGVGARIAFASSQRRRRRCNERRCPHRSFLWESYREAGSVHRRHCVRDGSCAGERRRWWCSKCRGVGIHRCRVVFDGGKEYRRRGQRWRRYILFVARVVPCDWRQHQQPRCRDRLGRRVGPRRRCLHCPFCGSGSLDARRSTASCRDHIRHDAVNDCNFPGRIVNSRRAPLCGVGGPLAAVYNIPHQVQLVLARGQSANGRFQRPLGGYCCTTRSAACGCLSCTGFLGANAASPHCLRAIWWSTVFDFCRRHRHREA